MHSRAIPGRSCLVKVYFCLSEHVLAGYQGLKVFLCYWSSYWLIWVRTMVRVMFMVELVAMVMGGGVRRLPMAGWAYGAQVSSGAGAWFMDNVLFFSEAFFSSFHPVFQCKASKYWMDCLMYHTAVKRNSFMQQRMKTSKSCLDGPKRASEVSVWYSDVVRVGHCWYHHP